MEFGEYSHKRLKLDKTFLLNIFLTDKECEVIIKESPKETLSIVFNDIDDLNYFCKKIKRDINAFKANKSRKRNMEEKKIKEKKKKRSTRKSKLK